MERYFKDPSHPLFLAPSCVTRNLGFRPYNPDAPEGIWKLIRASQQENEVSRGLLSPLLALDSVHITLTSLGGIPPRILFFRTKASPRVQLTSFTDDDIISLDRHQTRSGLSGRGQRALTAQHAGHVTADFGGGSWSLLQWGTVTRGEWCRMVQKPQPRQVERLLLSGAREPASYSAPHSSVSVCASVHAGAHAHVCVCMHVEVRQGYLS